jgi:hypothetical protein
MSTASRSPQVRNQGAPEFRAVEHREVGSFTREWRPQVRGITE